MTDVTEPGSPGPARGSRLRLLHLAMALVVVTAVYVPLRTGRANARLMDSLLTAETADAVEAIDAGADPDLRLTPESARPARTLPELLRRLLLHGSGSTEESHQTALMYAASTGNAAVVTALLRHGANVNLRLGSGYSALLYAAAKPRPDILSALLKRGADIHARTPNGVTPLVLAADAGQAENSRLLIAAGEDIHEADSFKRTPLLLAVLGRREDIVAMLLAQGAGARDLTPGGASRGPDASHASAERQAPAFAIPGSPTGATPLMIAARYGSPSLLSALWMGAGAAARERDGWALLCAAVQSGHLGCVRFLLDRGAPVNTPAAAGTPPPQAGMLPSGVLGRQGLYTPLHYACGLPYSSIARLLIARGADVNAEDAAGTTPLLAAAGGGHLDTVQLLLAHGADVRAAERVSRQTALMRAPRASVARALLDHGADVNARDSGGRTALMHSFTAAGSALLIARGADVNARDLNGDTALLAAVHALQPPQVELLLKHGARWDLANRARETPLSAARAMGAQQLVTLLTQAGATR